MLAKTPANRYADPEELLRALKRTNAEVGASECRNPADQQRAAPDATRCHRSDPGFPSQGARVYQILQATQTSDRGGLGFRGTGGAAAKFYEHASQVLAQGGGDDYARQLLDNCLKLDPFNLVARKAFRALNQKTAPGIMSRWFGSLNVLAIKSKLQYARSTGDWRTAFDHGEQLLAYQPTDVDTHLSMAETATEIGLPDLARWFLEQGRQQTPENIDLLRASPDSMNISATGSQRSTFGSKSLPSSPPIAKLTARSTISLLKTCWPTGPYSCMSGRFTLSYPAESAWFKKCIGRLTMASPKGCVAARGETHFAK